MGKKQGNKKRVVYVREGSWTCAFSWGLGAPSSSHPHMPLPQKNALVGEPPLQHNFTSHIEVVKVYMNAKIQAI
jgi:hypothetical protein